MKLIYITVLACLSASAYAQVNADEIGFDGCGRDIEVSEDDGVIVYDFDNDDQMRADDMFGAMWAVEMTYTFKGGYSISGEWESGTQKRNDGFATAEGDMIDRFSEDMAEATIAAIDQSDMADKELIAATLKMQSGTAQKASELQSLAATYTDIAAMQVGTFHNGMAIIYEDGLFGFVNDCFQIAAKPKYENVLPFYEEYAWVQQKGKWFKINKEGDKVK